MSIWQFQRLLTARLLAWSGFSIASGTGLALQKDPFWRGVGGQFIAWGTIDAAIALLGQRLSGRRRQQTDSTTDGELAHQEAVKLQRLLWLNAGLDILYLLGGWTLARRKGQKDPFWRGSGLGIVLQGGFLLLFDLIHALLLGRSRRKEGSR